MVVRAEWDSALSVVVTEQGIVLGIVRLKVRNIHRLHKAGSNLG